MKQMCCFCGKRITGTITEPSGHLQQINWKASIAKKVTLPYVWRRSHLNPYTSLCFFFWPSCFCLVPRCRRTPLYLPRVKKLREKYLHWMRLALKNKTTKALLTRSHGPKDVARNTNYLAEPSREETPL